jgi:hypothetical protein
VLELPSLQAVYPLLTELSLPPLFPPLVHLLAVRALRTYLQTVGSLFAAGLQLCELLLLLLGGISLAQLRHSRLESFVPWCQEREGVMSEDDLCWP